MPNNASPSVFCETSELPFFDSVARATEFVYMLHKFNGAAGWCMASWSKQETVGVLRRRYLLGPFSVSPVNTARKIQEAMEGDCLSVGETEAARHIRIHEAFDEEQISELRSAIKDIETRAVPAIGD